VRGRASVRVTDDGYLYAVDLAMVMTGADRNYASQVMGVENPIRENADLGNACLLFAVIIVVSHLRENHHREFPLMKKS
jgi:hypothetical protein